MCNLIKWHGGTAKLEPVYSAFLKGIRTGIRACSPVFKGRLLLHLAYAVLIYK